MGGEAGEIEGGGVELKELDGDRVVAGSDGGGGGEGGGAIGRYE